MCTCLNTEFHPGETICDTGFQAEIQLLLKFLKIKSFSKSHENCSFAGSF